MKLGIFLGVFALQAVVSLAQTVTDPKNIAPQTSTPPSISNISPQPAPIPEIKAENLQFNITKPDGTVCALFDFKSTITILNTPANQTINNTYVLGKDTTYDKRSFCDLNVTSLVLNINGNLNQTLNITVHLNETSYYLDSFEVVLDDLILKSNHTVTEKGVEKTKSYVCMNNPDIVLQSDSSSKLNGTLSLTNLKIDAFRTKEDGTAFRQALQCDLDFPVNDFVPLAVGCALISLVFIVLIAYIVGRKRSRRLTYQSV